MCVEVLASALSGLTPEQHAELRKSLDEVMMSVSTLRSEVAELRNGLGDIASTIIEDIRFVHHLSIKIHSSSLINQSINQSIKHRVEQSE